MGLEAGAHVTDNIRLVRLLGRGGMGSVWVARHLRLELDVAVKFIAAELLQGGDPIVLARFGREARLAAKLDSQHVVRTLDHGVTDDGTPYIVMELLRGESLAEKIAREGQIAVFDASRIVSEVAAGLTVAHAEGIVHRDIKPHNVFLARSPGKNEIAKVLDFGVAKATTNDAQPVDTSSGVLIGTPQYMSPEQLMRAGPVDATADLWALSVTAYEMLVGKLPFRGATLAATLVAITRADLEPPSSVNTSLPQALDSWFKRALAIDPDRRFTSAEELAEAFREATRGVHTGEMARPIRQNASAETAEADAGATAEFVAARALDVSLAGRAQAFAPTEPVLVDALGGRGEENDLSRPIPLLAKAHVDDVAKTARSMGPKPAMQSDAPGRASPSSPPHVAEAGTQIALASGRPESSSPENAEDAPPGGGTEKAPAALSRRLWIAVAGVGAAAALFTVFRWQSESRGTVATAAVSASALVASQPLPSSTVSAGAVGSASGLASAASSQPVLGGIPKTTISAGVAPASRVWLADYAIAREVGDENATFMDAEAACQRRAMSLCTDAQWARACEAKPEIALRPSWTVTAADSGLVVRGGASNGAGDDQSGAPRCTNRSIVDPATHDPARIGLCCSRGIGVASVSENAAFLKVTATKLLEFETAYDSGNASRIVALMDDPAEFHGKTLAKDDLGAAAVWMSKQANVIHDVCEVSIEKVDGETTWTGDCSVLEVSPSGLSRGALRYVTGGRYGLIEAVREPKSPVRLGPPLPAHDAQPIGVGGSRPK